VLAVVFGAIITFVFPSRNSAPIYVNPTPVNVNVYSESRKILFTRPKTDLIYIKCKSNMICFDFPEGSNLKKISQYFNDRKYFTDVEFIEAAKKIPRDKFPWLPEGIENLEGFLFPGKYEILKKDITPAYVINQMLKQFEKEALPLYKTEVGKPDFSLLEWVSLSSIVQKETRVVEERPQIARVFINRLVKGIKLESEPTVEYAFNIQRTTDRPLYFSEVRKYHSYNTYTNSGITPGPISSPGKSSLVAVLNPDSDDTKKLFFAEKYDGTHIFSATNAEHVRATRKIRTDGF
jgi:UPF0755 protein